MKYYGKDGNANANANDFAALVAEGEREEMREERARAHAAKLTGVHTTKPIESREMMRKWLQVAKEHDERRNHGGVSWYLLLVLGFSTGLRIGDLCKLKVKDVRGRERVRIIAEKTGKMTDIYLRNDTRKTIDALLEEADGEDWALCSRQRGRADGSRKPISRQRCYDIIKMIARRADFAEHVGCHTMRKTFAWNLYESTGRNLAIVQKQLNHSSQEATIHYLGLDQKAMDNAIMNMPSFVL
jgi:integrase